MQGQYLLIMKYLLIMDKKQRVNFNDAVMITGLTGIAIKPKENEEY